MNHDSGIYLITKVYLSSASVKSWFELFTIITLTLVNCNGIGRPHCPTHRIRQNDGHSSEPPDRLNTRARDSAHGTLRCEHAMDVEEIRDARGDAHKKRLQRRAGVVFLNSVRGHGVWAGLRFRWPCLIQKETRWFDSPHLLLLKCTRSRLPPTLHKSFESVLLKALCGKIKLWSANKPNLMSHNVMMIHRSLFISTICESFLS